MKRENVERAYQICIDIGRIQDFLKELPGSFEPASISVLKGGLSYCLKIRHAAVHAMLIGELEKLQQELILLGVEG